MWHQGRTSLIWRICYAQFVIAFLVLLSFHVFFSLHGAFRLIASHIHLTVKLNLDLTLVENKWDKVFKNGPSKFVEDSL